MKVVYTFQIKHDCQQQVKLKNRLFIIELENKIVGCRVCYQNARWFVSCCVAQFTGKGAAPGEGLHSCADVERRRHSVFISR